MKDFFLRNKSKLIIAISTLLILTAVVEIYFVLFVRVQSNDECIWEPKKINKTESVIIFQSVKVGGVTWNAGIRDGDELVEINNQKLPDVFVAQNILNKVKAGHYADYTVKSNGKLFHTKVYVKKLVRVNDLANTILALIQMLIGFIVLMAKPSGNVQKLFYGIGVTAVLSTMFYLTPMFTSPEVLITYRWYFLSIAFIGLLGQCSFGFLFLAFFWTFPKPFKLISKLWVRRTLIIVPLLIFATAFTAYVLNIIFAKKGIDFQNVRNILQYIFSGIEFIAFISLIINYRRLKTKEERKPIFIILVGLIIAFAAIIYTSRVAPAISDNLYNAPEYYTPIILIILIPIAFAYSIFKYQLMDVSVVIKNTLMYGTATVGLAAIYFFVIYILGQGISEAIGTEFQGIIAGLIFIGFAVVFQSTKNKYQEFLTAKFYPEQFAYQKVLIKFTNDLSTVVGLDNILDTMQETFVNALMINHFAILIKNKKAGSFHLVRGEGIKNNNLISENENLDEAVAQKTLTFKQAVFEQSEFPQAFPAASNQLINEEIYTVIPMIIKAKVIGMLMFGLKHSGSQFAGKDLELLVASANQAAVSIENARLYKSEAEKLEIERDLSIARKIQQGLLPKCIPDTKGLDICGEMIPAMQVGGDYYDLIPISDSQLFVVVGDVSGKGLAASLYMTKLQTMIQLACAPCKTPREIMIEVNKKFYDAIERNSFVTMTLALFDTESNKVTFCRAGHMPVLTAMNGSVHSYRTQGIGVGLEKGIIFEKTLIEEEVELKPGQIFAFFSDGITEAMNESLELFGEDNLSGLLKNGMSKTSTDIMNGIWDSINQFRGTAEQNDDMTMVIVKVK